MWAIAIDLKMVKKLLFGDLDDELVMFCQVLEHISNEFMVARQVITLSNPFLVIGVFPISRSFHEAGRNWVGMDVCTDVS